MRAQGNGAIGASGRRSLACAWAVDIVMWRLTQDGRVLVWECDDGDVAVLEAPLPAAAAQVHAAHRARVRDR